MLIILEIHDISTFYFSTLLHNSFTRLKRKGTLIKEAVLHFSPCKYQKSQKYSEKSVIMEISCSKDSIDHSLNSNFIHLWISFFNLTIFFIRR